MPEYYCTSLETPFDPGSSCKTIRLWERNRQVMSAVATALGSRWLIHSNGTLRTEYWNNDYWNLANWTDNGSGNVRYWTNVNSTWNPSNGIGWPDITGRRTMPDTGDGETAMSPPLFLREVSGMATSAKSLLNQGGIYQTFFDFGVESYAHNYAFDANNSNQQATYNIYGFPIRTVANRCNGTINASSATLEGICQGGQAEWHQFDSKVTDPQVFFTPDITGLTYHGQHLGVIMSVLEWQNPPQNLLNQALSSYHTYRSTVYKDGQSYVNFTNGGFNQTLINQLFPGYVKACNDPTVGNPYFYQSPSGRLISSWGETPAELLGTFIPTFATLLEMKGYGTESQSMLSELNQLFDLIIANPFSPVDAMCAPDNLNHGIESRLKRTAWSFANHYVALATLNRYPLKSFPRMCDRNQDGQINSIDTNLLLQRFGKTGGECFGTVRNDIFDYNAAITKFNSNPPPKVQLAAPTPATTPLLPDGINWGAWSYTPDITQLNNPSLNYPVNQIDSMTTFKAPNNTYFQSITLNDRYWNNLSPDFTNWSGWQPSGGGLLSQLNFYPANSFPFDSRTVYYNFQNQPVETITEQPSTLSRGVQG